MLSISRHDLLLAAVPLVFAIALALNLVAPVSLQVAVAGASLANAGIVVDALFLHPPSHPGGANES